VQVVSDMFAEESPDAIQVLVRCGYAHAESSVTAELTGTRLRIHVPLQPPPALSSFHVVLTATVHGRIVLPLSIGPIAVSSTLPRPLPAASWSREIPLSIACGSAGSTPTLRIAEAQTSTAIIASATWDPGVLLALFLAHAWDAGTLRAQPLASSERLRVVELGCGVGVAGLALAAAARDKVRVALTDGDSSACALSRRNAAENKLSNSVSTFELAWGGDAAEACAAVGGPPHLILAADVIYRVQTFGPLVTTLTALCDASSEKAEVLLAYRPRVDDRHFWHMLLVEFTATPISPPSSLMLQAHGGAHGQVTGSVASQDDATATPTRIYRLTRRSTRQPTACRDCKLRHAAALAANAAIANAKAGRELASRSAASA